MLIKLNKKELAAILGGTKLVSLKSFTEVNFKENGFGLEVSRTFFLGSLKVVVTIPDHMLETPGNTKVKIESLLQSAIDRARLLYEAAVAKEFAKTQAEAIPEPAPAQ